MTKIFNKETNEKVKINENKIKDPIIPNNTLYNILRGVICFLTLLVSLAYLIFGCSYTLKYKTFIFENNNSEITEGTLKGLNGEFISWHAVIPISLVSRNVSILCFISFITIGVYLLIFAMYTACKKYKFIQPWYFVVMGIFTFIGGIISIFISSKFYSVRIMTMLPDCPIQSVVSYDCSNALANDDIFAYDLCKTVEFFCVSESASMYRFYIQSIVIAALSFILCFLAFVYSIILHKLKIKYLKESSRINENKACKSNEDIEMSNINLNSICIHEPRKPSSAIVPYGFFNSSGVVSPSGIITLPNSPASGPAICMSPMLMNHGSQSKFINIPAGIVVTTTTSCKGASMNNSNPFKSHKFVHDSNINMTPTPLLSNNTGGTIQNSNCIQEHQIRNNTISPTHPTNMQCDHCQNPNNLHNHSWNHYY
ncbi:hypothetical protein cand_038970 [Cryptosporidium andersoni]|uniref:Uncharacterized protein n=1 Tax=Cryptosporidium andersoni TaxID=117008 RepID=A0A1J4MUC9_9CRYT|nr:hypothetical protein cand_038970 [Cryptosporidium andersoni]